MKTEKIKKWFKDHKKQIIIVGSIVIGTVVATNTVIRQPWPKTILKFRIHLIIPRSHPLILSKSHI